MKELLLLPLFVSIFCLSYSQDYDLIVKTSGDSIACRIDSVSDMNIYFEMKVNAGWTNTHANLSSVSEYKYRVLDKKQIKFKPGSSYLTPSPAFKPATSVQDIKKNTSYLELDFGVISANYERLIPLGNKVGITAGAGIITGFIEGGIGLLVKPSLIIGGAKHYFETGVMAFVPWDKLPNNFMPLVGYRYLGTKGFLFRGRFMFGWEDDHPVIWPGFSVGYAF